MKKIVAEEVRGVIRARFGNSTGSLANLIAKQLAKDGIQTIIPEFKELINTHIQAQINKIDLESMFVESFGWRSEGNKVLRSVLLETRDLIDKKIKQLFTEK